MISLFAGVLLAAVGPEPPQVQSRHAVLLAAAMVRHQEPVKHSGGIQVTVAEIYPIAWCAGGKWFDGSVDAKKEPNLQPAVRPDDRFQIYQNGWNVGWLDVNRVAPKPYLTSSMWVGLGGWSLPRKLYPYRLVRATNLNYLANSVYDWGNDKHQNSIQPFLALSVDRASVSSTLFPPTGLKRDVLPVIQDQMAKIVKELNPAWTLNDLRRKTLKAYDLDDDRIPEVVAIYYLPATPGSPRKTFTLIGTVEASAFFELYRAVNTIDWEPFDVIDVDGDGYKELVLLGRDNQSLGFEVLQGNGGKLKQVFEGARFGG